MTDVPIPGGRDVRGTLEAPDDPGAVVVACPPHPQHGGSRTDQRLVAVSTALQEAGIACLRFDYGSWDEGDGEREDVRNAVRWAREADRWEGDLPVGIFGYSFGASQALLAAAGLEDGAVDAVSVLAPTARLGDELDALEAYERLSVPVQVCYGERDTTVEWEPFVERARNRGDDVTSFPADHFFLGKRTEIASTVSDFFERTLLEPADLES